MIVDLALEPRFSLGGLAVRPATREAAAASRTQVLEPRVMQVLVALARRRGEVVSRDDLIASCWGGRSVGEDAINRCIAAIRRLSETLGGFSVETVARVGYRLSEGSPAADPIQGPAQTVRPSILVMPFANLSGDPEQDYFADGMVEEITRVLSRFRSIFVIGPGSGLSFKGKATMPQDAARTLGVRYVLEGSVRNAADRVRIAVKLIDGDNGAQIWSDRFEDTLGDVFALQDKVALSVASFIEPAVRRAEVRRAKSRPTSNMSCYDLYLRALALCRSPGKAGCLAALGLLERAIMLDPDFGPALALAAICHVLIFAYRWSDEPRLHQDAARALTQRALEVADEDSEVLSKCAMAMQLMGLDIDAAALHAKRATELNPGSAFNWLAAGAIQLRYGDPRLAMEQLERSLRLDPTSESGPLLLFNLGMAHFALGQFREAVSPLRQAAQLAPDWPSPSAVLAAAYGHLGEATAGREAIARYRALVRIETGESKGLSSPHLRNLVGDGIALAESAAYPEPRS